MLRSALANAVTVIMALTYVLAALSAQARDIRITAPTPAVVLPTFDREDAVLPTNPPFTLQESTFLADVLSFDPLELTATQPAPTLHLPSLGISHGLNVHRSDDSDGSSTVSVKQPLPTGKVETVVGADLNPASTDFGYGPAQPFPVAVEDNGSGSAWASIGIPNLASLNARVDPGNAQGQLGTTFQHLIPLCNKMSVTLSDTYTVTENLNQPGSSLGSFDGQTPATDAGALTYSSTPMQVWGNAKSVQLAIKSTGTTLSASLTRASDDPVLHNCISADQKLFGPLHVTTALNNIGDPSPSHSITAHLQLNW